MPLEPWQIAGLAVVVAVHAVVVLFLFRLRRETSGEAGTDAAAGDGVTCRACGAENDGQFQFCRECAAALPGGVMPGAAGGEPDPRRML